MEIILSKAGRRFNKEWIFRNIDYRFAAGERYALLGPNGSGKSTLMQALSGVLSLSEGTIHYQEKEQSIETDAVFSSISYTAPYLELLEEFSLQEMINFHFQFKKPIDSTDIIQLLGFEKHRNRSIKVFSSGMKQRLKLALAFCSDTPILLLDEPCSNLDDQGIAWYQQLLQDYTANRLVIIASNQLHEYEWCQNRLNITDYK